MEDLLKNDIGRPPIEVDLDRVDLKEYTIDFKFTNKLREVFKFWKEIVEKKAEGHTKLVTTSNRYELRRQKAFKGLAPERKVYYNKYIANFEALFGEIVDKFETLTDADKKIVLADEFPIGVVYILTNLKLAEVFPKKEDNEEFDNILLESTFSK